MQTKCIGGLGGILHDVTGETVEKQRAGARKRRDKKRVERTDERVGPSATKPPRSAVWRKGDELRVESSPRAVVEETLSEVEEQFGASEEEKLRRGLGGQVVGRSDE